MLYIKESLRPFHSTLPLLTPELYFSIHTQTNPDRTWILTADSSDQASNWAALLTRARAESSMKSITASLIKEESDDEADIVTDEEEVLEGGGEGVWMRKKGEGRFAKERLRYFMLVSGRLSGILRLVYYSGVHNGCGVGRKGVILITRKTAVSTTDLTLELVRKGMWYWGRKRFTRVDIHLHL